MNHSDKTLPGERISAHLESVETRLRAFEVKRDAEAARAEEALETAKEHVFAARTEPQTRRSQ